MTDRFKLNFPLVQDEDGYPPFASEGLWVESMGAHDFKIDNIPFYARKLSVGDIVEAELNSDGVLTYIRTIRPSSNSTIRVLLYNEGARSALLSELQYLGCDYEIAEPQNLVAVNVPDTVDIGRLLMFLDKKSSAEEIDYEESAPRYLSKKK